MAAFFVLESEWCMETAKLQRLIDESKTDNFYQLAVWKRMREQVMKHDHYECQLCKAKGRYRKGVIVHHVKHLKQFPALAYQRFYVDENGQRHKQLVPLCRACHEYEHNRTVKAYKKFTNEERW